jgi:hypothetical protein
MEQDAVLSPTNQIKENPFHLIFFLSISIIPTYPFKVETSCFDGADLAHQSSLSRVILG